MGEVFSLGMEMTNNRLLLAIWMFWITLAHQRGFPHLKLLSSKHDILDIDLFTSTKLHVSKIFTYLIVTNTVSAILWVLNFGTRKIHKIKYLAKVLQ